MSYPDHNTINRFRSDRLKGVLKEVFSQVVLLLVEKGTITLKEAYLDGTKIEAKNGSQIPTGLIILIMMPIVILISAHWVKG